jgi:hypothetical protein
VPSSNSQLWTLVTMPPRGRVGSLYYTNPQEEPEPYPITRPEPDIFLQRPQFVSIHTEIPLSSYEQFHAIVCASELSTLENKYYIILALSRLRQAGLISNAWYCKWKTNRSADYNQNPVEAAGPAAASRSPQASHSSMDTDSSSNSELKSTGVSSRRRSSPRSMPAGGPIKKKQRTAVA